MLLSAFGCAKNPNEAASNKIFKASMDAVKSEMGADGHTVLWNKEDRISVYDGVENNCFSIDQSSLNGSSANFTGKVSDDASQFVALYPYSSDAVPLIQYFLRNSLQLPAVSTLPAQSPLPFRRTKR